jgi:hypothetical protein
MAQGTPVEIHWLTPVISQHLKYIKLSRGKKKWEQWKLNGIAHTEVTYL